MQRLYFLTPNSGSTIRITDELHSVGIGRDAIHVVCRDSKQLDGMELHKANVRQTSDVMHAAKRGAILGAISGAIAGAIAAFMLPVETPGSIALTILGVALLGLVFGIWASTMIGVSIPDVKVDKFESEIRNGSHLMLVDVPPERERDITQLIMRHHPEAVIEKVTAAEHKEAKGVGA